MVEIGPGLGALTEPLLRPCPTCTWWKSTATSSRACTANISGAPHRALVRCAEIRFCQLWAAHLRVVGNLPYNISTPMLFHLAGFAAHIIDMHFMLQKEVVERMVAAPSTPEYGRLSVMLQYPFVMDYLLHVPPQAFSPPPKVESAVVRMLPWRERPFLAQDEELLSKIVLAAFAMRRKTLRNTLHAYLKDTDFEHLGIDPGLRAENIGVEDFVRIANYCHSTNPGGERT